MPRLYTQVSRAEVTTSILSAVLPQTGNTSESPFCILIEAFDLDLQQRNIRWAFTGRRAFTGRKPLVRGQMLLLVYKSLQMHVNWG